MKKCMAFLLAALMLLSICVPAAAEPSQVVNILVVGQAGRYEETVKLADTIMLFSLNKATKQLTVTSFLRDTYVDLPDYRGHTCSPNRINVAYALGYSWYGDKGAMEMLDLTLANNFGVTVDGNVEFSFEAFEKVIDLLGGLSVDLNEDETAYLNETAANLGADHDLFTLGENLLSGEWALHYVRMRHAGNADSDFRRTERQRQAVDQIIEKLKKLSITEITNLLETVLPMVITDISEEDMQSYIADLLPMIFDLELVSNQCPKEGTSWGEIVELPDGPSAVLKYDLYANRQMMQAICEGN